MTEQQKKDFRRSVRFGVAFHYLTFSTDPTQTAGAVDRARAREYKARRRREQMELSAGSAR